jgi:hypothetical protein
MVDLETFGQNPGCAILSLAAVCFWRAGRPEQTPRPNFACNIDPVDCQRRGLLVDAATALWWLKQNPAARANATAVPRTLDDALGALTSWLYSLTPEGSNLRIWGNGASFDPPILEAAYRACGLQIPWRYHQQRCYRTLAALHDLGRPETTAHQALLDADDQSTRATTALQSLWP